MHACMATSACEARPHWPHRPPPPSPSTRPAAPTPPQVALNVAFIAATRMTQVMHITLILTPSPILTPTPPPTLTLTLTLTQTLSLTRDAGYGYHRSERSRLRDHQPVLTQHSNCGGCIRALLLAHLDLTMTTSPCYLPLTAYFTVASLPRTSSGTTPSG